MAESKVHEVTGQRMVACGFLWLGRKAVPIYSVAYTYDSLEDQLIAVEALGNTKDKRAFDCINRLLEYEYTNRGEVTHELGSYYDDVTCKHVHASPQMRAVLDYERRGETTSGDRHSDYVDTTHPDHDRVHSILTQAKQKLALYFERNDG